MPARQPNGHVEIRRLERGDVYYAKGRLADGKQFRKSLGKVWAKRSQPPAGYLTEFQAKARLALILSGDDPFVNIAPTHVTFKQACDEWLTDRERDGARASTMYDYRSTVRSRLVPFFGASTPVESITTDEVDKLRDAMSAEGRAGRTINKTLAILHGIYKLAVRRHKLAVNPVATALRAKQRRRKLEQWLTVDEVAALVAAATTPQDAALYEVAAWTGLRWGELRALRWGDVHWSDTEIYVSRNWPVRGPEGDPKSGKPRRVPLADQAAQALAQLGHREHFTRDDDYVFATDAGAALDYDVTRRRFYAARDRAGLRTPRARARELTFHDLRHTYGTLAARFCDNLREVQEYMGHASITTTEIYAHFQPRKDAAARFTAGLDALRQEAGCHASASSQSASSS